MSSPIALGGPALPPSPFNDRRRMQNGKTTREAPITPTKLMPSVDRAHTDPQIVEAAENMEAMFLDELMKAMRQTVPKNDMDLENTASEIYRGMMDSEIAQKAARGNGTGLADQLIAYLDPQRYTLPREQGVPQDRTGGTHAGQPNRK